jgi:Protein of unknown function (DUF2510)
MYDFESVSVSSFEAASLAATLTEKSADGWDVVAIVPAGSDVVAYLRRSSATDSAGEGAEQITDGTSNTIQFAESTTDSAAAELLTPTSVSSEPAVTTEDITSPTSTPAASDTGGTGWGAGTESSSADTAGGWTSGSESSESSSWGGSAQQAATPATPSVPAGWYADPAGRFELRYWDGAAWTEHVSRAGQQYTDPPVA